MTQPEPEKRAVGTAAACDQCGGDYLVKNYNQRFCSGRCRDKWHNDERAKAIEEYKARQRA